MKYQGKVPIGEDRDYSAFVFSLRREEVKLLKNILEKLLIHSSKTLETMQSRGRMLNMKRIFLHVIEDEDKEKYEMQKMRKGRENN